MKKYPNLLRKEINKMESWIGKSSNSIDSRNYKIRC